MSNPRYVDDPDFYERPGETVHLITDVNPARFTVPRLPWQDAPAPPTRRGHEHALFGIRREATFSPASPNHHCPVCGRVVDIRNPTTPGPNCAYCARAHQRDETHKARAKQPQPTTPRIHVTERWESWAKAQPHEQEPTPHIREHETRIG